MTLENQISHPQNSITHCQESKLQVIVPSNKHFNHRQLQHWGSIKVCQCKLINKSKKGFDPYFATPAQMCEIDNGVDSHKPNEPSN